MKKIPCFLLIIFHDENIMTKIEYEVFWPNFLILFSDMKIFNFYRIFSIFLTRNKNFQEFLIFSNTFSWIFLIYEWLQIQFLNFSIKFMYGKNIKSIRPCPILIHFPLGNFPHFVLTKNSSNRIIIFQSIYRFPSSWKHPSKLIFLQAYE